MSVNSEIVVLAGSIGISLKIIINDVKWFVGTDKDFISSTWAFEFGHELRLGICFSFG